MDKIILRRKTVKATYADENKINWRSDLNKPELHTYKIPPWVVRLRLTKVWLWIMGWEMRR